MGARTVLISGLGIAGPTLAYWLRRHGFEPTLVERAPAPREGGYIIDFWGVGLDVAEKMGVMPALLRDAYDLKQLRFVDRHGAQICAVDAGSFKAIMGERYLSVLRSGLARILFDTVRDNIECRFSDSISGLDQDRDGVTVTFERGDTRRYDLVVGADGLHSVVRNLAFGPEAQFEAYYGYHVASFGIDDYPIRDEGAFVSHTVPRKQIARYALRDNRTAAFLIFRQAERLALAPHDVVAQKQVLRAMFRGEGWECAQLLERMDAASDFYFDVVSQIRMPTWSAGRVALVGDAGFCPSLLSGQGSAIAMAGAYVLAGELKAAAGDHVAAFAGYEARFRSFVAGKQRTAERFAGSFVPATRLGVWVRNQVSRMMFLPAVTRWFGKRFLVDPLALPSYDDS